jgi:hypothetical protein
MDSKYYINSRHGIELDIPLDRLTKEAQIRDIMRPPANACRPDWVSLGGHPKKDSTEIQYHNQCLLDIEPTEVSGLAIGSEQLVEAVNTSHIMEDTKCKVFRNPGCVVHKVLDRLHEVPDLVAGALCTTREVLASKLGRPDGEVEGAVEVLKILDELLGVSSVPMKRKAIKGAAITSGEELLHPSLARGSGSTSRRDKSIALVLEGLDVLLPNLRCTLWRHLSLARLVRLVEAKNSLGITRLDKISKVANLLLTPKHGDELDTETVNDRGLPRTPGVNGRNLAVGKVLDGGLVGVVPSKADLAAAAARAGGGVVAAATRVGRGIVAGRASLGGDGWGHRGRAGRGRGGLCGRGSCGCGCYGRGEGRRRGAGLAALGGGSALLLCHEGVAARGVVGEGVSVPGEGVGLFRSIGAGKNGDRGEGH